jgi:hypothetical protein
VSMDHDGEEERKKKILERKKSRKTFTKTKTSL